MANFDEKEIMKDEVVETAKTEITEACEECASTGSSKGLLKTVGIVAGVGALVALGLTIDNKLFDKRAKKKGYVKPEPDETPDEDVIDIDFDELDIENPGDDEDEETDE